MASPEQRTVSTPQIAFEVLEDLLEGVQVLGFDWTYLYLNETAAAHARRARAELLGRTIMACYPGVEQTPMFAALARCMATRAPARLENEFRYPDGVTRWFELRVMPTAQGVCVLSLDITDAKRAEAALRRAQKMEAIGRLAGGVAHDFNNFLSVVLSYSEMLGADPRLDAAARADLGEVRLAGLRAADLTRQLLAFSSQQVLAPTVLDLNACCASLEKILRRLLGADVELVLLPAAGVWPVAVDQSQIEQVVMNLVVNARDAMPAGGTLTIETANVELDDDYAQTHPEVRPGAYVRIAVSDTGVGMAPETQARIFEPFFTTKERGKGTGLGLATVFGIVAQSGGHIWVYSEPGHGSVFKIYFPRADGPVADTPNSHRSAPLAARGTETILLVDDDDQVRAVASAVLRRHGYQVLEASSGGDALLCCEQHAGPIDLLVTDVVLPRLNGPQVAERLAALRPALKVLFMSGYTGDAVVRRGVLAAGAAYLPKPLTPGALVRKVREVLDASAPRA